MEHQRLDFEDLRLVDNGALGHSRFFGPTTDDGFEVAQQRKSLWRRFGGGTGPEVDPDWMQWRYLSVSRTVSELLVLEEVRAGTHGGPMASSSRFVRVRNATGHEVEGDPMVALADAVTHGDHQQFIRLLDEMRNAHWEGMTKTDFVQSIRWALQMGVHQRARELAQRGHVRYPKNEALAKLQRLTAPPRVLPEKVDADPSIQKDQEWLAEASAPYRGQWVALRNGELVAAAPSARALKEKLGELKGYLITKVV